MISFHGYITSQLLEKGRQGSGFSEQGIRVRLNGWMSEGDSATFILCEEDVDIGHSIRDGRICTQATCYVLPGHLEGTTHTCQDAAIKIADKYFNRCADAARFISNLRNRPEPNEEEVIKIVRQVMKEMA